MTRTLAYMSDHDPMPEIAKDLENQGFKITAIPSPEGRRWNNAQEAYMKMKKVFGNQEPEAVVLVMPPLMGGQFIKMVKYAKVYRPEMIFTQGALHWTGAWAKLLGVSFKTIRVNEL